jgi:HKD family nuclease
MIVFRLENELKPALHSASEVMIATAKMTQHGLDMLIDKIQDDCKLQLLVGVDMLTPAAVLRKLMNINKPNWEVKIFTKPKLFFHPKVYIVKGNSDTVFVGSANYTKGGMMTNVELSYKSSPDQVPQFEDWFRKYFNLGVKIEKEFLDEYDALSKKIEETESTSRNTLRDLKKKFSGDALTITDLTAIDFTNQFFKYEHFNAFTGTKPTNESAEVNAERAKVWDRLYELHEQLYPAIQAKHWDVHPHHMQEFVVSSYKHGEYTNESLSSLWLHYGRSEADIERFKKDYGDRQTSMYQIRLQILVLSDRIYVWLSAKNGGGVVDRTKFKEKMRSPAYRDKFFNLLQALPKENFISINDEDRFVHSFADSTALYSFVKEDNITQEYFIIGRQYKPDDNRLSSHNIVSTIIDDFMLLYPIYLHLRELI